jgi:hypothetical protein
MAEQLKADIKVDKLRVGPHPTQPNKLELSITNSGDAIKWKGDDHPHLYLKGALGPGANALFLGEADVRQCQPSIDGEDGWYAEWDYSATAEQKFRLHIYTFNQKILAPSKNPLTITLDKVISQTAPGDAGLTFEVSIPSFKQAEQVFSVTKAPDKPDIINFTSEPPEGVQNFPNQSVTLKWRVYGLNSVELTRVGNTDFIPFKATPDSKNETVEGVAVIKDIAVDTQFRLRGYADSKPVDRILGVRVLRNDWYDLRKTIGPGDGGYPPPRNEAQARALKTDTAPRFELEPALLWNDEHGTLYAIFRHDLDGEERALLFRTQNPFAGWNFVESSVEDQPGLVPEGFATSPGVYCNGQLWLIGGSQVELTNTSSSVWRLNPRDEKKIWKKKTWSDGEDAPWSERMGHGVVFLPPRIWVMGGCDQTGKAINDVWWLDIRDENNKWNRMPDPAPWAPRCLISPTVYNDRIWVYGGTKQPTSAELYDDLYTSSPDGAWEKMEMTDVIKGRDGKKPVASCLQVFQNKLHLLGKFQTVAASDNSKLVESLAFSLSDVGTKIWSRFPSDRLQNWWGDTASSYQLVNFKLGRDKVKEDEMLIARALGDRALDVRSPNTVLKVYVP